MLANNTKKTRVFTTIYNIKQVWNLLNHMEIVENLSSVIVNFIDIFFIRSLWRGSRFFAFAKNTILCKWIKSLNLLEIFSTDAFNFFAQSQVNSSLCAVHGILKNKPCAGRQNMANDRLFERSRSIERRVDHSRMENIHRYVADVLFSQDAGQRFDVHYQCCFRATIRKKPSVMAWIICRFRRCRIGKPMQTRSGENNSSRFGRAKLRQHQFS